MEEPETSLEFLTRNAEEMFAAELAEHETAAKAITDQWLTSPPAGFSLSNIDGQQQQSKNSTDYYWNPMMKNSNNMSACFSVRGSSVYAAGTGLSRGCRRIILG